MKIALIYFSPTGNTKKIADAIQQELIKNDVEIGIFNITKPKIRRNISNFLEFEQFIFGFPIFYWRIPEEIRNWLKLVKGNGKKCATFFTYGGITSGVAPYDTGQILKAQDFNLLIAAEFLGKHTFNIAGWNVIPNRPNSEDLNIAREFAQLILKKFRDDSAVPIDFEKPQYSEEFVENVAKSTKRAIPLPYIVNDACKSCGICEKVCPNEAINIEEKRISRKKCMRCLKCILECPENALRIKDMSSQFQVLEQRRKLSLEELNLKKSKIYL